MPHGEADMGAIVTALKSGIIRHEDGRISFATATQAESTAFIREWLILIGEDPEDFGR
jgi:hypothetical protein